MTFRNIGFIALLAAVGLAAGCEYYNERPTTTRVIGNHSVSEGAEGDLPGSGSDEGLDEDLDEGTPAGNTDQPADSAGTDTGNETAPGAENLPGLTCNPIPGGLLRCSEGTDAYCTTLFGDRRECPAAPECSPIAGAAGIDRCREIGGSMSWCQKTGSLQRVICPVSSSGGATPPAGSGSTPTATTPTSSGSQTIIRPNHPMGSVPSLASTPSLIDANLSTPASRAKLSLVFDSADGKVSLLQGRADASQPWGTDYRVHHTNVGTDADHPIYPLYRARDNKLLFVNQINNVPYVSTCSADKFDGPRNDCSTTNVSLPRWPADRDVFGADVSGGSAWAAITKSGDVHGFVESGYDSNLWIYGHNHPLMHFFTSGESGFGYDEPFRRSVQTAFIQTPIDTCGLMGSDAITLNREVGNTEEIHAFYAGASRKTDGVGWVQYPNVSNQGIKHVYWDGAWHCDYATFGESAGWGRFAGVVQDGSSFGVVTVWEGDQGADSRRPYSVRYRVMGTDEEGKTREVSSEEIPGVSRTVLDSYPQPWNYGVAIVSYKDNKGSDGSINLFYADDEGNIGYVQKKGDGVWTVMPSVGTDAATRLKGSLKAAVTPEGDLHVFGLRQDLRIVHAFTRLNALGNPGEWKYEVLDTRGFPGVRDSWTGLNVLLWSSL